MSVTSTNSEPSEIIDGHISIGFDLHGLDQSAKEDQAGIEKASKMCKTI